MSATLIAVVVVLVLGHVAPSFASAVRKYGWYGDWLRWLDARFGEDSFWRGRWGIVIALLPPLLPIGLLQLALDAPLLGFGGLLFATAVLFYAWGPRDLERDVGTLLDATDPQARREAVARLLPDADDRLDGGALVEAVFRSALRRWFGVLFWFLLLGAFGALLYRLTALAVEGEHAGKLPGRAAQGARALLAALEWPVAQLLTLALALVGNFDAVLGAWRDYGGASLDLRNRFFVAAARASVRSELAEETGYADESGDGGSFAVPVALRAGELPELRDAMSLVWRCLLVWLAVMALFVIAGWVG